MKLRSFVVALVATFHPVSALAAERKPPDLAGAARDAAASATRPAPPAKQPEIKPEMRAIAAGQPGADGWVPARSEPGGFSVTFPGRYNDFSVHAKSVKGTPVATHALGMNLPERGKFSVVRMVGGDIEGTDALAKEQAKNLQGGYVRDLTLADGPAYEVIINGARSCRARFFARGGNLLFAMVEYSPNAPIPATAAEDAERFFNSIKIDANAPGQAPRP